jgi:RNA polymerase sigma-70 factor (ECF subfamily)
MATEDIDHLFRHHYGKMVSVLTRIFGLSHLETIEDAVQDTFIKASISWRSNPPENPEAWLTLSAKNRVLDLFRKLKAERERLPQITSAMEAITLHELFLDTEIADSQLRMIFTACHPRLDPKDRISFALKTVSGFSNKEIAAALLTKGETIKKRLNRARKTIQHEVVLFKIPEGKELPNRLETVLEVIYLIFNEGFHSNRQDILVRKELCAEALRLCTMLIRNTTTNRPIVYALFALICFHSARIDAKTNADDELIDLKTQDRSLWYFPLIKMGDAAMYKAVEDTTFSSYHYEAAIAAEHLKAKTFEDTHWKAILKHYENLYHLQPMPIHLLHMAVVQLQLKDMTACAKLLSKLRPQDLEQRAYLYHGTIAEYYVVIEDFEKAIESIDTAIRLVTNQQEKKYLEKKRIQLLLE